jgi:hypothetical protein
LGPRWIPSFLSQDRLQELVFFFISSLAPYRKRSLEKLAKLTEEQFHELSTDVYDEVMRRNWNPFEGCAFSLFPSPFPLPSS